MRRREFLALGSAAAVPQAANSQAKQPVKLGIDLFSIRSSNYSPFEYLDYCAKWKANVVHFSEVRFLGSLDPAHVKKVSDYARKLNIELEIGMSSICPSSTRFRAEDGTAEEQLSRVIEAARVAGSPLVRAYLGTMEDRKSPIGIEGHIENTARVLRNVKTRAVDADVKIAIENHAGDMQGRELKMLIEEAGKDFVGACIDSGNPLWTIEDPHVTLETLAPFGLTSHVRDSAVWKTPNGAIVRWVRTGEGNVEIDEWIRKYAELCPGKACTMEVIVTGPREFPYLQPDFWDGYRNVPAWQFSRFLALVEKGKQVEGPAPASPEQRAQREREDLEASTRYVQELLGMAA
ncbi:MAG: sugar phosphate isomerase/epimerase [Bryobacteraceae bacterium]|nr:sugar phosphate isomerase/epimerase [Bryobacteraceae bacterium]